MPALQRVIHAIDGFTDASGRALAWLSLAMCLITTLVVVLRYGFNWGDIAMQESVTYLHASLFMLGAGYTLKYDDHVRVDIFYRRFTPRQQAWVNGLGGVVFLLPLCVFILGISWDYVAESWRLREVSSDAGGLGGVFLLKTLIPLFAINLLLQGLAETLRALATLLRNDA